MKSLTRWPSPVRRAVTAIAVAVAIVSLHAPAPAHAATAHQLRVVTHNIGGGPTFRGSLDALDGVNAQISAFGPDVVMLEEVCGSQVDAFKAQHPTWSVLYSVMATNQHSCTESGSSDARQGQMLASPYAIASVSNHSLGYQDAPYPSGEPRRLSFTLLCGDIAIPGHSSSGLRACVTHLRAGADSDDHDARETQTATIRSLLTDRIWSQGQAVTVAGDFNAVPYWNAMNNMYRLTKSSAYTGTGDFHEADQTDTKWFSAAGPGVTCGAAACRAGERTYAAASKLDYAFISRNVTHGGAVSALAVDQYGSDHHLYRAYFNILY